MPGESNLASQYRLSKSSHFPADQYHDEVTNHELAFGVGKRRLNCHQYGFSEAQNRSSSRHGLFMIVLVSTFI
jgi:hypothetical protein